MRARLNRYEYITEGIGSEGNLSKSLSYSSTRAKNSSGSSQTPTVGLGKTYTKIFGMDSDVYDNILEDEENECVENFDQVKSYTKYFVNGNLSKIIQKYTPQNVLNCISVCSFKRRNAFINKHPNSFA